MNYYYLKLIILEFFWNIRLYSFSIITFNSKYSKKLFELKTKGVVVIPKYFTEEYINLAKKRCKIALDNSNLYNKDLIEGSIKIKHLGLKDSFFKTLQHNFFLKIISFVYMFKFKTFYRGALMIYSLTHDGSYKHPSVPGKFSGLMIAGDPHFDESVHGIKAFVALKKIESENGPFTSIIGSNCNKLLFQNYINHQKKIPNSHIIDKEKFENLKMNNKIFEGTVDKGDLVIMDTRNVHYASSLKKGVREMLWFYY